MTKDAEGTNEAVVEIPIPEFDSSHWIVYGDPVYCKLCKATAEQLFRPCPEAIGSPKEEG